MSNIRPLRFAVSLDDEDSVRRILKCAGWTSEQIDGNMATTVALEKMQRKEAWEKSRAPRDDDEKRR